MKEQQWLEEYVQDGSQEAFACLVRQHLSLVYGVALRQVHDSHLAEDAAQATFALLARKAVSIRDARALPNWLFRAARYAAANALRLKQTRRRHEQKAAAMRTETDQPDPGDAMWQEILPRLEQAMEALPDADRQALLLRFYEDRSLREVGESLCVSEDAARKRVDRAVGRLREALVPAGSGAGVALGASVDLAALLSAHAFTPAPAALAASIASTACQAAVQATLTATLLKGATGIMATTTAKIAAVTAGTLILVGGTAVIVGQVGAGTAPGSAALVTPQHVAAATTVPAAAASIDGRPINEIVAAIVIGETTREELVGLLGEPNQYLWQNQTFTPERLPERYVMLYAGLTFMNANDIVEEMRFEGPSAYKYRDRIGFGTPLAEVLEVLGQPTRTVEGQAVAFQEGVLYRNCRGGSGYDGYYQRRDQGIRLFLAGERVAAVYLTRTGAVPDSFAGRSILTDRVVAQLQFGKSTREDVVRIMGEPLEYGWSGRTFAKDILPETYIMGYRSGDGIAIQKGHVAEIRIDKEGPYSLRGLRINSTMADVAKALGEPKKVVSGRQNRFEDNIWYKDIDGLPGRGYFQRSDLGVRMFLRNDTIAALYLIPPTK